MSISKRNVSDSKPIQKAPTEKSNNKYEDLVLNFEEIQKLISLIGREPIDELNLESPSIKFHIRKSNINNQLSGASDQFRPQITSNVSTDSVRASEQLPSDESDINEIHYVTSPIVGTFYRAPNVNAAAFVQPGDSVKTGQTLCIIEAMKLMNEIECDVNGDLVAILVEDGQPVEYGERLFSIRVS